MLSGKFGSAFGDYPAIGAVVAHELGYRGPMPPYFAVPRNPSFTWELGKSAFLGGRYESFKSGDPNDAELPGQGPGAWPATLGRPARPPPDAPARRSTTWPGRSRPTTGCGRWTNSSAGRWTWSSRPRPAGPSTSHREDPRLRDRYGRTTTGQGCLLARRLVEAGVRFVTVNSGGWDHHANIFPSLDRRLPEFDAALSALIDDLDARGLLDSTLVVAMGEFGRTPKINDKAGRDHWGHAASLVFAGGGVAPGRVIGQTDDQGAYVTDRPVSPADVAATIYQAVGVDPSRHLMTPENRPVAILDEGSPIAELFA